MQGIFLSILHILTVNSQESPSDKYYYYSQSETEVNCLSKEVQIEGGGPGFAIKWQSQG